MHGKNKQTSHLPFKQRKAYTSMLWSDAWTEVAVQGGTRLPPPPPVHRDLTFVMKDRDSVDLNREWVPFVQTKMAVYNRLANCLIPCLYKDSTLVGTLVFRHIDTNRWAIETLVARPQRCGYGGYLIHAAIHALYERVGPHMLVYVWELRAPQLWLAYWKGWLKSMVAMEYGWISEKGWLSSKTKPGNGWRWTGEFVVVGNINCISDKILHYSNPMEIY